MLNFSGKLIKLPPLDTGFQEIGLDENFACQKINHALVVI